MHVFIVYIYHVYYFILSGKLWNYPNEYKHHVLCENLIAVNEKNKIIKNAMVA